jgi:hypothetical protein
MNREYSTAERSSFRAPECPECGRRLTYTWTDVTSAADSQKKWVPTAYRCPGSKCPNHEPSMAGIPGL